LQFFFKNRIKQEAIQKLKQIKVESGLSKPDSNVMEEIELIDAVDQEDDDVDTELYLSVKLLDLYLNGRKVEKEKLQLLGGAAMSLIHLH